MWCKAEIHYNLGTSLRMAAIGQKILARRAAIDISSRQTLRESRDALLQRAAEEPDLSWRVLGTLNAFRALIALALLVIFFSGGEPRVFGDQYPTLFWTTTGAYLALAIAEIGSLSLL